MKNFFKTIKSLIVEPTAFFKLVAKDKSIKKPLIAVLTLYIINLIGILINPTIWLILFETPLKEMNKLLLVGLFVAGIFTGLISGFAFFFLAALILHGFYKIFQGKGTYKDSFNLLVYSIFPFLIILTLLTFFSLLMMSMVMLVPYFAIFALFLAVPLMFLRLAAMVWYGFLITIGGSIIHKISKGKSAVAGIVLPLALLFILGILGVIIIAIIAFSFGGF